MWAQPTRELLGGETRHLEYKQSARWSVNDPKNKKLSEQIIIARIGATVVDGEEVCRLDVPASSRPIWTSVKKAERVVVERRNNSISAVPDERIDTFIADRFGSSS